MMKELAWLQKYVRPHRWYDHNVMIQMQKRYLSIAFFHQEKKCLRQIGQFVQEEVVHQ